MDYFHRIKLPDGSYTPGIVNHGPDGGDWPTTRFGLPEDLSGKSVLDIGCYDGFFSFEAERRGAKIIVPVDKDVRTTFRSVAGRLGSSLVNDMLDIEQPYPIEMIGTFDVVLLYGVLYHVKCPLDVMDNLSLATASDGMCLVETAISNITGAPVLEYRPGFDNDPTNYFYPNKEWMELAATRVGFNVCEEIYRMPCGSRATYKLT